MGVEGYLVSPPVFKTDGSVFRSDEFDSHPSPPLMGGTALGGPSRVFTAGNRQTPFFCGLAFFHPSVYDDYSRLVAY